MGLGFVIATTQQMPQVVINDQTLTTLGTVFIVLSPLAVAFWWITRKLNKIDNRLADIEDGQAETWCAYQQEAWVLRLVNMNQELGLKVPDVDAASLVATARRRRREMDDNES